MTAQQWTRAVREQVGLGRFLPLGGPHDGAWIAERAAAAVLRSAVRDVGGVRLGALRIGLAAPGPAGAPVVPAPPSALPPGPLRVTAQCTATAAEPLPVTTERLRRALARACAERVGLVVGEVDLRVTDLLEAPAGPGDATGPDAGEGRDAKAPPSVPSPPGAAGGTDGAGDAADAGGPDDGDERRVAEAALAVPGVARLAGSPGRAVRLTSVPGEAALPHRQVRVDLAVGAGHRALDVALAVRAAVRAALPDRPAVAVLVTAAD
ncbi:nucleopolyhedrovirus P10 family protein [Streptomyces sp. enrichment culture]|uniref:nucleopolyhedrovirus P10 family protein n=1 Tax=Streptomyces sp. enrichment culture TaxID=1795815 RepID=UPI003F56D188